MRVATVDGLVTVFYDESNDFYNIELIDEWIIECDDYDHDNWEEWDISDECKEYWRQRLTWQQVIIEEGVTVILEFAFVECSNIQRVICADTVIRIEEYAFQE